MRDAIKSIDTPDLAAAVAGSITVAAKKGWLGQTLKNTPAGRIANAVSLSFSNLNTLWKFSKGELNTEEVLSQMKNAACSILGGLVGSGKGVTLGAILGTVLGPVGTVIGGIAGGMIGGAAGNAFAETIYEAGEAIVKDIVEEITEEAASFASGLYETSKNFLKSLLL